MNFILDAIDGALNPAAIGGMNYLINKNKYIIVRDEEENIICLNHAGDIERQLIEAYLKKNEYDKKLVKIDVEILKKEELVKNIQFKLVMLDDELVLYGDVIKKSGKFYIDKYTGKMPKSGLNVYKILSEKK